MYLHCGTPYLIQTVSKFYRPTSLFNWNGTSVTGVDKIKEFLAKIPSSKHEIQSSDCHAVPGTQRPTISNQHFSTSILTRYRQCLSGHSAITLHYCIWHGCARNHGLECQKRQQYSQNFFSDFPYDTRGAGAYWPGCRTQIFCKR